jgi:hypothetical protein
MTLAQSMMGNRAPWRRRKPATWSGLPDSKSLGPLWDHTLCIRPDNPHVGTPQGFPRTALLT